MARAQDTIFALSSGSVPSGVAVIRMSGLAVRHIMDVMIGRDVLPRQATLTWIHSLDGVKLDKGLVLYFEGPASFTGEDCLEFHVHGGRAVLSAIQGCLQSFPGVRMAEAGEFSRRAFDNGKLDLVEIEGLADLIGAETEMQRRLALEQSRGGLSKIYLDWMNGLTRARALIEAELDFPDEDDVPGSVSETVWQNVGEIAAAIQAYLDRFRSAEIIRDGFHVVIAGRPNAGKSSLLNALAKRDVAIVTEIAGTTRDTLSVDLDLAGFLVRLTDTAGLRETEDPVERLGVARANVAIEDADLVIVLKDKDDLSGFPTLDTRAQIVMVETKWDMGSTLDASDVIYLSAETGFGIDSLTKRITDIVHCVVNYSGEALSARLRHRSLLEQVLVELEYAVAQQTQSLEIRAESLRLAAHSLGKITGFVGTEDLLSVIFSEFCIGK